MCRGIERLHDFCGLTSSSPSPHHRAHLDEGDLDPLDLGGGDGHGEGLGDVRAELDGDADAHHQVDLTHAVQLDVPDVHQAEHVRHHHRDHLRVFQLVPACGSSERIAQFTVLIGCVKCCSQGS